MFSNPVGFLTLLLPLLAAFIGLYRLVVVVIRVAKQKKEEEFLIQVVSDHKREILSDLKSFTTEWSRQGITSKQKEYQELMIHFFGDQLEKIISQDLEKFSETRKSVSEPSGELPRGYVGKILKRSGVYENFPTTIPELSVEYH